MGSFRNLVATREEGKAAKARARRRTHASRSPVGTTPVGGGAGAGAGVGVGACGTPLALFSFAFAFAFLLVFSVRRGGGGGGTSGNRPVGGIGIGMVRYTSPSNDLERRRERFELEDGLDGGDSDCSGGCNKVGLISSWCWCEIYEVGQGMDTIESRWECGMRDGKSCKKLSQSVDNVPGGPSNGISVKNAAVNAAR